MEFVFVTLIMGDCQILQDALENKKVYKNFSDAKEYIINEFKKCDSFNLSVFDKCNDHEDFNYDDGNIIIQLVKLALL